jgi:transposase
VVAAHPVDFRKSVHTLSALVSEALRANPYCGDVFVFRSKRTDWTWIGRVDLVEPGHDHLHLSSWSECRV